MTRSSDSPLLRPVASLFGVSPEQGQALARIGIRRVHHLLFHFPRDYEVVDQAVAIDDLEDGVTASVVGVVAETDSMRTAAGQLISGVLIRQDSQHLRARWFNQQYIRDKYYVGQRVRATGKARYRGCGWEMVHPQLTVLDREDAVTGPQVVPVYPLTAGIRQPYLRRLIGRAVSKYGMFLEEALPPELRERRGILGIRDAVRMVHAPVDEMARDAALRRFRYQELLVLQLALAWQAAERRRHGEAPALVLDDRIDARIRRLLPFPLTADQDRVVHEIAADMASTVPMHRLLQGDVGSGKTLVAAYAMLLAIAHGHQAAMMAPTEILAQQHFAGFQQLLARSRVRMALLAGSMPAAQRRQRLDELAAGELDLVVGTHALASDDVRFHKPGLVVVDEQHKFGVRQRAELRGGQLTPHYLTMSATPIPRTLARALMGEPRISSIQQLPPGRQPVHTYLASDEDRAKWWQFFRRKLDEGRQGVIVSPFITGRSANVASDDANESDERLSAETLLESLAHGELEAYRLDLLHGRMSASGRAMVMESFRAGKTQALVSTSLIEVGIDIPNLSVMTIEHADRFGLAQLHQLRGRVGRGVYPGYVCLFSSVEDARTRERLQQFVATTSGFEVAELDLRLRGPGELLGTLQHGSAPFRVADLERDIELLEQAGLDAQEILAADPLLEGEQWRLLRRSVMRQVG